MSRLSTAPSRAGAIAEILSHQEKRRKPTAPQLSGRQRLLCPAVANTRPGPTSFTYLLVWTD